MMKRCKILLFIPMFNCEKQITRVLSQITDEVQNLIMEVIIVNNRSTDNGEQAVIKYLESHKFSIKVSLLRNDENYGLGGSHKVAFNYAIANDFDYVIVLHGDDQGNIEDLTKYLNDGSAYKYDSFLGARFHKNSNLINYSKIRIIGNHIFNIFTSICLFRKVIDLGSGLNMYSTKYLKSKFYLNFVNSLSFNVYMLIYGVYSKSNFCFFSLTWREDDQVSNAKFLKQSMEIFKILISYVFLRGNAFINNAIPTQEYSYKEIYVNCI